MTLKQNANDFNGKPYLSSKNFIGLNRTPTKLSVYCGQNMRKVQYYKATHYNILKIM